MAQPKTQLVTSHLEHVSWRALEQYPQVIRDFIRSRAGVYALFKRDRLYYVGLASNLMSRLKQHLHDRHHGAWDRFSVYLTRSDRHLRELESLLIRILQPKGNRQAGAFVDSTDLKRALNQQIKEDDADKRARLLGGHVHRQRRRKKATSAKGAGSLAGLQDRRRSLRGYHKGWEYSASLLKSGQIRYGNKVYDSPSAAAKACINRPVSGWTFWKYRDPRAGWVPLSQLRK